MGQCTEYDAPSLRIYNMSESGVIVLFRSWSICLSFQWIGNTLVRGWSMECIPVMGIIPSIVFFKETGHTLGVVTAYQI